MQNKTTDDPLLHNCRPNWPEWTCMGANICGLCSTTLWFLVLLPQVWKNFRQKSVLGLSVLWGTANFTASLINLCFVYGYAEIPLYGKINSIYMPILEFSILVQFWIYGDQYDKKHKIAYLIVCLCVWTTLISLNLGLKLFPYIQWIAIGLWCVETFPQVFLNFKLRSTSGQSTRSVVIASIGKMTDFLSTYGLVLPIQYVVMTYFSSSVNYVNAIQVVWFYGRKPTQKNEDMAGNIRYKEFTVNNDQVPNTERDTLCSTRYVQPNLSYRTRRTVRYSLIAMFTSFLCLFAYGIVWATKSYYAMFAPITLVSVTGFAFFWYRRTWNSETVI
ncbi:uncharacterized protein LOC134238380 [Saccostrea cucullata]|uniref:uncharacterized protein LOC134238380 n=1 Tax=Saccostrea cuccullata TaxID=36930 RepID=UPI002ED24B9F